MILCLAMKDVIDLNTHYEVKCRQTLLFIPFSIKKKYSKIEHFYSLKFNEHILSSVFFQDFFSFFFIVNNCHFMQKPKTHFAFVTFLTNENIFFFNKISYLRWLFLLIISIDKLQCYYLSSFFN